MPNVFAETISAAIADLTANGFDSAERVAYWSVKLREAAKASMLSEDEMQRLLKDRLTDAYVKMVDRGGLEKFNKGIARFTIEKIKPQLRAELDRRILASANLIKLNRTVAVEKTIQRFQGWATSIPKGGSNTVAKGETKDDIRKSLAQLPFEERRVIIDQGHKFAASLSDILATDGGAIAAIWHHHHVTYPRPEHVERDGDVFLMRGSWADREGLVKPAGPKGFTDSIEMPGEFVFCFPGESQIQFADGVKKAYRRWYSGELAEIVTASGKTLRPTPNHPVLTPDGFVAVGTLNEGDYVVEVADDCISAVMAKLDADHAPFTIAEIFAAVAETGTRRLEVSLRDQFHGDGSADGNVDIITAARPLLFDKHQTMLAQREREHIFAMTDHFRFALSSTQQFLRRRLRSESRIMSRFCQSPPPGFAFAGHPNDVSFGAGSQFDLHVSGDRSARYAEPTGKTEQAFPFAVRPTRIVKIERRQWSGHVFNLQTKTGWYVAEGIIAHNCRCTYQYLYHLRDIPSDLLTARGKAALAEVRSRAAA